jgi:hypothetical protein
VGVIIREKESGTAVGKKATEVKTGSKMVHSFNNKAVSPM